MLNLFLSHFFYRQRSINRRKESLRKAYTWQTSTSRLVYRRKEVTKSNVIFPSHGFPKCMPCSWFLRSAAGYSYLVRLEADLAEENINPFDYMRSSEKKKTVTFFFIPYYPQPHPVLRTFFPLSPSQMSSSSTLNDDVKTLPTVEKEKQNVAVDSVESVPSKDLGFLPIPVRLRYTPGKRFDFGIWMNCGISLAATFRESASLSRL